MEGVAGINTCDASIQEREEGWMRFEVVKCCKALIPVVQ